MDEIDEQTGRQLLGLARRTITSLVSGTSIQTDAELLPSLPGAGVFVTLRKQGALRGCIGTFYPTGDLTATIQEIAVAATRDPRFRHLPIASSELSEIRIELSVLSELTCIEDPLDFELGHHGIHLLHGNHTGCFLPDVATEAGWG
ncbi:MAG: AmmeMemoRadiSam system protein A [Planctomycetes bacterium]|nr:AmmeMemoRadiSam system protein A [Planctomycetota bacterium]